MLSPCDERLQLTSQEKKQYDWYMKRYQNADKTRDPEREREKVSMIIVALFPHCSHTPLQHTERKASRKKGLQGETPGESRDEIKARTAAQKLEQQQQRAKAQQQALKHAAPSNVHHMSTRQKAQSTSGPSAKERSPSPSQSSSSDSSSSTSTSSSHTKQKDDEPENKEVTQEQSNAPEPAAGEAPQEQPNVPASSQSQPQPAVESSMFYKLSKRLSKKTPASEAFSTATPFKDAQETLDMPPPDIPRQKQIEPPPSLPTGQHESGASSYASAEEPESQETHLSSSKRRRSWASLTSSASEDERHPQSVDLQSHDPRPASVAMAGWGQGLGTATVASSLPDEDRPVLAKPLILAPGERIMEAGRLIESTLPVQYEENQAKDPDFIRPSAQLPAWKKREEFIKKLDGSRLLIIRAPTGSGKTTIYPALAAKAIPKRFGRVCCTQVRRATTQGVCTGTKRMWHISPEKKVVGFQHGLEKSSEWDVSDTRVLFLTEGIIMRQAMKTPDMNSPYGVIEGCAVLMLDEVHSGSSDMELILARVLPKLKTVTNFKVVLLSATLNKDEFLQRAREAGLEEKYIQTIDNDERHQALTNLCLPPLTSSLRDNIEMAVRTIITFHHKFPVGYPSAETPMGGTILVFVPGKPEITEIVELLKNNMRRGFTAKLYPYGFHSDTPAQDRDFLFNGTVDPNESRRNELRSLANGSAYEKYLQQDPDCKKYGAADRKEPSTLTARTVIVATNAAETAVTFHKCWLCIDTCMVNQMMYDATLRAKVQQTVPCSQAASMQRGGRAGRESPGVCVRLVTQVEWDNMPPRDPPQPHMDDQTSLYLRVASTEADSSIREQLLDTLGMTKELRAEAQQMLFLHDLVDVYGHLTDKGSFVSNLDCETEHGCLLWIAHEYHVLSEALIIFTILSRNPTFVSNEFKKLLPHPDGDLHTMLNAWNTAAWLQHLTLGLDVESSTRVWGKYNLSQRQFEVLCEHRNFVAEKCSKQFKVPVEQLEPNQTMDKNAMSRLSLALFRAFKTSLLVRNIHGHYSMINGQDQWEIASTSTVKFAPSLVISPSRTVRILGQQSKSEEPPAARLDIVMGVPEEFLLTELWYCQNHKKNSRFSDLVDTLLAQPVYSHLARVERICPAMGITPIPACELHDVGVVHDVPSFEQYFAPTCWLYEKSTELVHEKCVAKRTDFPLEIVRMTPQQKEIPQACYNVTYMLFPSANWESKAKKLRRKGGTFFPFLKNMWLCHIQATHRIDLFLTVGSRSCLILKYQKTWHTGFVGIL